MKLKDPLQGVKMAQGHIVVHITFFLIQQFCVDTAPRDGATQEMLDKHADYLKCFNLLKWGHLYMFLAAVAGLYMKRAERHTLAQLTIGVATFMGYFFPIFKSLFVYRRLASENQPLYGNSHQPEVRIWVFIDLSFFFLWILSLAIFLLSSVIRKKYSIFKSVDVTEGGDLWQSRKTNDFLRYLKWEAFNYSYFYGQLAYLVQVNVVAALQGDGLSGVESAIYAILFVVHLTGFSHFICQLKQAVADDREAAEQLVKTRYWSHKAAQLLGAIIILVLYFMNDKLEDTAPIFKLWVKCQIIFIFTEIFYFEILTKSLQVSAQAVIDKNKQQKIIMDDLKKFFEEKIAKQSLENLINKQL